MSQVFPPPKVGICVFSQWSGNGLIPYYLTKVLDGIGIANSNNQALLNGILALYNFTIAITASMSVERVGRRPLFVMSTVGMLVSYAIITAMSGTYENSPSFGAGCTLLFIFNGFCAIAYTPLLVSYTIEMLPSLSTPRVWLSGTSPSWVQSSSITTPTPSTPKPSSGSTTSSTPAGSCLNWSTSGSGPPRPRDILWRRPAPSSTVRIPLTSSPTALAMT